MSALEGRCEELESALETALNGAEQAQRGATLMEVELEELRSKVQQLERDRDRAGRGAEGRAADAEERAAAAVAAAEWREREAAERVGQMERRVVELQA